MTTSPTSLLAIFDFDKTITEIDANRYLLKELAPELLPGYIAEGSRGGVSWVTVLNGVLEALHAARVDAGTICGTVAHCPLAPGMAGLIALLGARADVVAAIVSDANELFIRQVLRHNAIEHCWRGGVHSNLAWVDPTGRLRVRGLMGEDGRPHGCERCPRNMCKEPVVQEMISKVDARQVIYVGDGRNDFCGAKCLPHGSTVYPRKGFGLEEMLSATEIKADVVPWGSPKELQEHIQVNL